jgi:hypothetical protein
MLFKGLKGVLRARRCESTARATKEKRFKGASIDINQSDEKEPS